MPILKDIVIEALEDRAELQALPLDDTLKLLLVNYHDGELCCSEAALEKSLSGSWRSTSPDPLFANESSTCVMVLLSLSNDVLGHASLDTSEFEGKGLVEIEIIPLLRLSAQMVLDRTEALHQPLPAPVVPDVLDACSHYFLTQFRDTWEELFINLSVAGWRRSIELTHSESDLITRHRFLVVALMDHWYCTEDPDVLSSLIAALREAILHTPDDHPALPLNLYQLGESLRIQIVFSRDPRDLDEAISSLERAVELTSPQDPHTLSQYSDILSRALSERYYRTEEVSDLHRAIGLSKEALDILPDGDPIRDERLYFLGTLLDTRYEALQNLEDLDRAIGCFKEAVAFVPEEDLAGCIDKMDYLARSLKNRFGRNKSLDDIRLSMHWYRKAINFAPEGHPGLPQMLSHLGVTLRTSFRYTEDLSEVDEAIEYQRRSIELTSEEDPALAARLHELGVTLEARFGQTESLEDIQEALVALRKSVEITPDGHPAKADHLIALAEALGSRSFSTGEDVDAGEAIAMLQKQVDGLSEDDPRLPGCLFSLSSLLANKYSRTRDPADLDLQIAALRRGAELTVKGHLGTWMNCLAMAYNEKLRITKDLDIAENALTAHRKAIDATPIGHAARPGCHNSMAITLRDRFNITKDIKDIDEAIAMRLAAFELASHLEGYAALPVWYSGLAGCYNQRYSVSRELSDIEKAIDAEEKAIGCYHEGHTQLPECHRNVGDHFIVKFEGSKANEDRNSAVTHYRLAALSSAGSSKIRMEAARKWGKWTAGVDTDSTMEAFERAIDLLSEHVALEQTQSRRHENIANTSGLSTTAAAVALHAGKIEKALEWLERGRCLVWSQLNRLRTPLDELRAADPELAGRLLRVSRELEMSESERVPGTRQKLETFEDGIANQPKVPKERVDLTIEWKRLIGEVRQKSGFENFLQATPLQALLEDLPKMGTVVIINAHDQRCDALALRGGDRQPIHIPLPQFSVVKAQRMVNRIREQLGMRGIRARGFETLDESDSNDRGLRRMPARNAFSFSRALGDLWVSVVQPILETIGCQEEGSVKERIWWCPTGPFVFLPFHAAGEYRAGGKAASDFVVSSYIPNISILATRSKAALSFQPARPGVLLVSQPNTPGHTALPGTTREINAIQPVLEGAGVSCARLEGEEATVKTAMVNMTDFSCVHLACHATQDRSEPLASGFFLQDGRLQLSEIIKNNLAGGDLAFLSACQTSTGDEKLSEEAVHLAAGMLAAGYRAVVGTMWSIQDRYAPSVAECFYNSLLDLARKGSESMEIDGSHAAEALHQAINELRGKLGNSDEALMTWVPYVHFGL